MACLEPLWNGSGISALFDCSRSGCPEDMEPHTGNQHGLHLLLLPLDRRPCAGGGLDSFASSTDSLHFHNYAMQPGEIPQYFYTGRRTCRSASGALAACICPNLI